jgi:lactoylglutathione lyase
MQELKPNIKQAVPFFFVVNMEESLKFYLDGLGFELKNKWTPAGKIEWCWIERDNVALMLQEFVQNKDAFHDGSTINKKGEGVSICFVCEDALSLYHEFFDKGLNPLEPFVGNNMWEVKIIDPDGYQLHFESATDVPEETKYSEWKMNHGFQGFQK